MINVLSNMTKQNASDKNCFRMNRVTQFVSFTSIMSVSMTCLAVMLLFLARGTQYPVAVQVTFYHHSHFPHNCEIHKVGLVASLMVTTIAYGMGVGAVPYTMVGELFTPEHRTLGSCLAQVVRWVFPIFFVLHFFLTQKRHRLCPRKGDPLYDPASWTFFYLLLPRSHVCCCGSFCLEVRPRNPRKNTFTALLHLRGKRIDSNSLPVPCESCV